MLAFRFAALTLAVAPIALVAQTPPAGGPQGDQTVEQYKQDMHDRLMAADKDKDGRISKAEFMSAQNQMMGGGRGGPGGNRGAGNDGGGAPDPTVMIAMRARMFDSIDVNHDGYLDASEIDTMAAARAAQMDANHDGVITADERRAGRGGNGGGNAGRGGNAGGGGNPGGGQ